MYSFAILQNCTQMWSQVWMMFSTWEIETRTSTSRSSQNEHSRRNPSQTSVIREDTGLQLLHEVVGGQHRQAGLGNMRGFYCNSNFGGSELQWVGQFLSPLEFDWKELIRTWKVQKSICEHLLLGNGNKAAVLFRNTELGIDLSEKLSFSKRRS